jgi:hypothetical protein
LTEILIERPGESPVIETLTSDPFFFYFFQILGYDTNPLESYPSIAASLSLGRLPVSFVLPDSVFSDPFLLYLVYGMKIDRALAPPLLPDPVIFYALQDLGQEIQDRLRKTAEVKRILSGNCDDTLNYFCRWRLIF